MAEVLDIVVRQRGARKVSKDIAAIGIAAQSSATKLKGFQQAIRGTATAYTQASGASAKFTAQCQKSSRCTNQAAASMKKTKASLSGIGAGAAIAGAALTAGFVRPLTAAIGAAGSFESAMNLTGVLSNVDRTSAAFKSLETTALQLGSTTQFTAVQAAEGMQFLALAGLEANETLAAIPDTLKIAAAGGVDLGRAADITTNILKGFGLELEALPQAVDILASTFTNSNVDLEQLSASFRKVGPVASQAGQSFSDTAAILGTLGNAGLQAEESGTALRRLFLNLDVDAAKTNSILGKFGISVRDVNGEFRPMIDIFKDISKVAIEPADRIKLFGARAIAAATIIEKAAGGLDEFSDKLENDVGRASAVAEARLKGFDGAVVILKSSMEGLGIAIANSGLLDFLTKAVKGLTGFVRLVTQLPGPILAVIGVVGGLAAVLAALLVPLGLIAIGISTLAPLFAGGFVVTLGIAGAAVTGFLATIAPFVAVIGGLIFAWSKLKDVQFDIGGSTVTLSSLFAEAFDRISDAISFAVKFWKRQFKVAKDTVAEFFAAFDFGELEAGIQGVNFNTFIVGLRTAFAGGGRIIGEFIRRAGVGLGGFASDVVDLFGNIPAALKAAVTGDFEKVGELLGGSFQNGMLAQLEGFGEKAGEILLEEGLAAQAALAALGETEFVKGAAGRIGGAGGAGAAKGKLTGNGAGGPADDDDAAGKLRVFTEQQEAAAAAVQKLVDAMTPGAAATNAMSKAITELDAAQKLGVISGERNVELLRQIRESGGEEFLASINPVTAAYRDQRVALEELAVAKQIFNLTDQEAMVAGELIAEQTQERLLQLDQFKEKLSGIDSVRMGLSEGFKDFVKGLGTQFDIVSAGVTQLGGVISNQLTTAIKEGEFSFKEFGKTVIDTIAQIVVQLLIQIALQAVLKALGGTSAPAAANGASITPMADGGPVSGSVGQTFLVGEEGPELFVPKTSGDIVPNGPSSGMLNGPPAPPPVVNVQVVNVDDQSGVPDAMSTREGEKVILNTIQKNRNQLKEIL